MLMANRLLKFLKPFLSRFLFPVQLKPTSVWGTMPLIVRFAQHNAVGDDIFFNSQKFEGMVITIIGAPAIWPSDATSWYLSCRRTHPQAK